MPEHILSIRSEAESEIAEAHQWYELHREGLGSEFLRAVEACLASIQREPYSYPTMYKNLRRALLRKFPYSIFFVCEQQDTGLQHIIVFACFHARRNPKQWQKFLR